MVGVNTVKKNKAFGNLGYRWDEKIQIKHEDKKKKLENIVNVIYKQCGKREYFHESYMVGISEKGERENEDVQHLKVIDGSFPKVMKTPIFALIKLY